MVCGQGGQTARHSSRGFSAYPAHRFSQPVSLKRKQNSELVVAHRVMQFTADRAGLLLAGSPTAAIRAMFAAHPASLAEWALVRRHPLVDVLIRGEDASERDQMLAVRVAAMLAFFVSPDFATLRQAVVEHGLRGSLEQATSETLREAHVVLGVDLAAA